MALAWTIRTERRDWKMTKQENIRDSFGIMRLCKLLAAVGALLLVRYGDAIKDFVGAVTGRLDDE